MLAVLLAALILGDSASCAFSQAPELPPPCEPRESLAKLQVRPGYRVELVAHEPLVADPVDIAFGPDGKLWVVEMGDYPLGVDGRGTPGGRVRFLEDVDGDGRYDRSTLFIEGIPFPTGVMPWRDGVLVSAAPEVFFAADTDGDGKADHRETLLRGFGEGNQQHRVNGLRWGLDNWVYLANGDSDGKIHSTRSGEVVDIRGRDLRFRPDDGRLDPQTGRAQYGRNRDDWGNWFGCNNSNPLWHYSLADQYLRRNSWRAAPPGTTPLAQRAPQVFPVSETLARFNDLHAANRFTSACGAAIYRDDLLNLGPERNAFICEPVHNLVHRRIVTPQGTTFASRRAEGEEECEFLASSDHWFRPVAVHTGPDGALWVVDMYRAVIEHPQWIPEDWQKQLDLRAGHDRGRIYRILPEGVAPRKTPRLDGFTSAELVQALDSPNGWQRDMAQQLLVWRKDASAAPLLARTIREAENPLQRLHALCTLDGMNALSPELLLASLDDRHPGVRRHAVRLSEQELRRNSTASAETGEAASQLAARILSLAEDDDVQVRMQVAYTLGEFHHAQSGRALAAVARSAPDDAPLLAAVCSAARTDNIASLVEHLLKPDVPDALRGQACALAIGSGHRPAIEFAVRAVTQPAAGDAEPWRYSALAAMLAAASDPPLSSLLPEELASAVDQLIAQARGLAEQEEAPLPHRAAALQVFGRDPKLMTVDLELLPNLLQPQNPPELQLAALEALARIQNDAAARLLIENFSSFTPRLRAQALDALLSRPQSTLVLLDALSDRSLQPADIDAERRQRLMVYRNSEVRRRAEQLLGKAPETSRAEILQSHQPVLEMSGDHERGRPLFVKHCANCHRLGEQGFEVGPDLRTLKDHSPQALLTAILDPNRAVEDKFLNYTALTTDGLVRTGMLAEETGGSITLRGQQDQRHTIRRSELELLQSSGKSLMPEGMERDLSPQALADIIAFVRREISQPARQPSE